MTKQCEIISNLSGYIMPIIIYITHASSDGLKINKMKTHTQKSQTKN